MYRKFDPHRPYQFSLYRTCKIREAAKGSNKSEERRQAADETCGPDGKPTKKLRNGALHPELFAERKTWRCDRFVLGLSDCTALIRQFC
jgi:hypothetical protein